MMKQDMIAHVGKVRNVYEISVI